MGTGGREGHPGIAAVLWIVALVGCKQGNVIATVDADAFAVIETTTDPAYAATLQADVEITAASVVTLAVTPTATDQPLPTFDIGPVEGDPITERVGACAIPDGFVLHVREGFCIAAPATWLPYNVDGGLAASLQTTPGQAISLRPDWATSADLCHLLIYIAAESSALDHLETRHAEFTTRTNLTALSAVHLQSLAGAALPGFTWTGSNGEVGGVYADLLGPNRLVHISFGGTQCPREELDPVLATLKFE